MSSRFIKCSFIPQNLRNVKANQVSTAVHDLIKAVSPLDEAELLAAEPDNMITNIMEVDINHSNIGVCIINFDDFTEGPSKAGSR